MGESKNLVNKSPYSIPASFSDRGTEIEAHTRVAREVLYPSPMNCIPNKKKCLPQKCKTTVLIADKKETGLSVGSSLPAINYSQLGRLLCLVRLR